MGITAQMERKLKYSVSIAIQQVGVTSTWLWISKQSMKSVKEKTVAVDHMLFSELHKLD